MARFLQILSVVSSEFAEMSFSNRRLQVATLVLMGSVLLPLSSEAAPATSQELENQEDMGSATSASPKGPGVPSTTAPGAVPQSRTVELLLQLQDQPQGMGQDGIKADPNAHRRLPIGARRPSDSDPQIESNPLGSLKALMTDNKASDDARRADNPQTSAAPGALPDNVRPGSTGSPGQSESRGSLLHNPVVRFIRENRMLTISISVAVLAAIWLTATVSVGRSRR